MPRYRSRSRSYDGRSRSPPRRKRYEDTRERYRDNRSYRDKRSFPSGLLVRNISLDARPEDLRVPFERYGPVKDVYIPKNYYTGEPRGFGFVKFRYAEDAAEALQQLHRTIIGGREIRIVFAEENRKTPQEMRVNARVSSGRGYRRRASSRSPRRRGHSYSHSPSPRRQDLREMERNEEHLSPEVVGPVSVSLRDGKKSHSPLENGQGAVPREDSSSPSSSSSRSRGSRGRRRRRRRSRSSSSKPGS